MQVTARRVVSMRYPLANSKGEIPDDIIESTPLTICMDLVIFDLLWK